jgi:hypothetical protein
MRFSELPFNPFDDNVVFEPREAERPIAGLNDRPLAALLKQFERLEAEPRPRRKPLRLKAQLVTSAEPGYGKSHLIGRLFKELGERATQVYLRPFQDAGSSWRSILLKVVQELDRPDDPHLITAAPGQLTQLDAIAFGVMAHLLAGLIEKGRADCENAAEAAREMRLDPLEAFGHGRDGHYLLGWMRAQFPDLLPHLLRELRESGVILHSPARAWLRVLHAYAFSDGGVERDSVMEWLKDNGLSAEEVALLGLDEREITAFEETASKRNEDAMHRLHDLLTLAGFYRPFLFCFDQTELFTAAPDLCAEFGSVIEQLVNHGLNHMIVVTANLEPWARVIVRNFQTAHIDRFTPPIELEGMTQPQALAMARQRLAGCGVADTEVHAFCDDRWLDGIFHDKKAHSVRAFLRFCARRCADLSEGRATVAPELSVDDYYAHYEREVRSKPIVFDPDVLRWSVGEEVAAGALPGVQVERFRDSRQLFPISWKSHSLQTLFGFEDSSHSRRWDTILREATKLATAAHARRAETRIVCLRTSEQHEIPGPGWRALGPKFEAASNYFSVHVLSEYDIATVFACYELYANVVEGNAQIARDEALLFIHEKLRPWWSRLLERPPSAEEPSAPLIERPSRRLLSRIRAAMAIRPF